MKDESHQGNSQVNIRDVDGGIKDSTIAGRDVHLHSNKVAGDRGFAAEQVNKSVVITGDDNEVIFQVGSLKVSRKMAILLVIVLLIAVICIVISAVSTTGMFIDSTAPTPTSTPMSLPFAPAKPYETLIVIAAFHSTVNNTVNQCISFWD